MSTNAGLGYAIAQKKLAEAKTPEERLAALLEMQSEAPKHKGAERLRADLNKKVAEARSEIERSRAVSSKKGSASVSMYVKKDGAGQIVIVGLPNSGKSWLLNKLVGKEIAEVTPYPFATKEPVPAMFNYEGALIQIVELPALIEGSAEGKAQGREIIGVVRNSDAVLFTINSDEQKRVLLNEMEKSYVYINRTRPPIAVKGSSFPGIQISGKEFLKFPVLQLEMYLKNSGYQNCQVIISGPINSLGDVAEAMNEKICYKKAVFVNPYEINDHSIVDLKDQLFLVLDLVLVFTKKPGKEADMSDPLALPKGSTIFDLAKLLHKDFAKNLKFAKVWGSTKFPGQTVGPDFVLKNKDIVEIAV
jgi:ribosome-interacting GTPase 1